MTISVSDINEHIPVLGSTGVIEIQERSPVGSIIREFTVSDADPCSPNNLITITIDGFYASYFRIQENVLVIASDQVDFETFGAAINITITVQDRGSPQLQATENVEIIIHDINDEVPEISNCQIVHQIEENVEVGKIIGTCEILDKDLDSALEKELTCECQKDNNPRLPCPIISFEETATIIFSTIDEIDFETASEIFCTFKVTDTAANVNFLPQVAETSFVIIILNQNDNIPAFDKDAVFSNDRISVHTK